jgi:hypothetical protein
MNIVLDSLRSVRNLRALAHAAGLLAYLGLALQGVGGAWAWLAAVQMLAALLLVEGTFSLLDGKARRLRRLAPGAFPFKKMDAAERAFLQDALGSLPRRGCFRSLAAWTLAAFVLGWGAGLRWEGAALLFCAGAPLAAAIQGWGAAVLLRRVLPFFYFEDYEGYARGLSRWIPVLGVRVLRASLAPLGVALAPLALLAALGSAIPLGVLAWQALLGLTLALGQRAALRSLLAEPLRDLAEALRRLSQGDLQALLDVTDGGELGEATEAHNRALRAVDRRLFLLEKFGLAVPPGRSEGVLDNLRLDGEWRPVAVLSARWNNAEAALRGSEPPLRLKALSRFYEAVQDAVDRAQGSTFRLDDGAVLAVWGAPYGPEGVPSGALAAAWDLQRLLPVLASQFRSRDGLHLEWGLGVASGQACTGLAGPYGRERYGVHGGPVVEAQALAARGGGAWLDERSAAKATAPFGTQVDSQGIRLVQGPEASLSGLGPGSLGFQPGERLS